MRSLEYRITKNKANAPYTILLVGAINAGKSSLLRFIANALLGNDIYHYDPGILGLLPHKRGIVSTASSHLYEIMSASGILVSSSVFNAAKRHNRFLRFVSSTRLDWRWKLITVLGKIVSTKRVL